MGLWYSNGVFRMVELFRLVETSALGFL